MACDVDRAMGSCLVALLQTISWPKVPAGKPATHCIAFGKQDRRRSEMRTSTLEAHFLEIEDTFSIIPC